MLAIIVLLINGASKRHQRQLRHLKMLQSERDSNDCHTKNTAPEQRMQRKRIECAIMLQAAIADEEDSEDETAETV